MKSLFLGMVLTAAFLSTSAKAETIDCTEITSVPFIITAQGVYCLKSDKSSSLAGSINIIDIRTNNVTIDLNGFKLGGLGAGPSTLATGIRAENRKNITIRNGSIRGFLNGIVVAGVASSGGLLEDSLLDGNRSRGIIVEGTGHIVRNNRVVNTGGGLSDLAAAIRASIAVHTVIADNVISGVFETTRAVGIEVENSLGVDVRGNNIFGVAAPSGSGVEVSGSTTVTVIDNRVLNNPAVSGTFGIIGSEDTTNLGCIGNTVNGFVFGSFATCDFSAGNNFF